MKTPAWQDNFQSYTVKGHFFIGLTRAMIEFISAVADDCHWDRTRWGSANPFPDSFLSTERALIKRGLIERKPQAELDANKYSDHEHCQWAFSRLTPAGKHVVKLLEYAGFFVESDAAIEKKARQR